MHTILLTISFLLQTWILFRCLQCFSISEYVQKSTSVVFFSLQEADAIITQTWWYLSVPVWKGFVTFRSILCLLSTALLCRGMCRRATYSHPLTVRLVTISHRYEWTRFLNEWTYYHPFIYHPLGCHRSLRRCSSHGDEAREQGPLKP